MKTLKAAAVVAGSLAIAGVTVPASALDMPGQGLVDSGKSVASGVPTAAKVSTSYVGNNVEQMASHVKDGVQGSVKGAGVKTPLVGGALPQPALPGPVDGQLLGGLPVGK
ncbi:hypothetical protein LXH13_15150 [Streptomyces spinosirectus]|jgi:hypothetical protein|uniref:hypothetical protein n=1 Tax=Streptomyces TaxID=1883 RepID=UPI000D38AB89|nr:MULTISPECIES: hypothetical protein [Streptomyces]MBY8345915.1 hypothetical protein [Streptomyces plumbidurans]PTM88354.1 hypothetical protein C7821_114173 [Streptomyces sp. VMFN-G11Ma]UIR18297.1 hypothetical protein LXH13_15150 [Streptomyces spinosirectus]